MESFRHALRRMRQQRYSLRTFAREVNFAYTYVGQVERGEKIGSSDFASRVDRVLGADGELIRLYAREDQLRRGWREPDDKVQALYDYEESHKSDSEVTQGQRTPAHDGQPEHQRTPAHEFDSLGLTWSPSVTSTVETVIQMWRADMQRRNFLVSSAFTIGGFTPAVRDWLISWRDTDVGHKGGRQIGDTDVAVLWDACYSFQEMDRRLGGATTRSSLVHFLDNVMTPILAGTYDDGAGRQLLTIAGRLTDIAAYSAYDAHEQGMAQRYYIQALRMARSANNESLGAHILGDMTRQAYYVGDFSEAVALARAGQQAATKVGSYCGVARCASIEARALAMQRDYLGADQAMSRAESAMDRANPGNESPWIRYFSVDQLQAEFAHACEAMKRNKMVLEFAQPALKADRPLERRNLLVAATAARAHVASNNIEEGARLGVQALELVRGVASERGREAVRSVRARLRPHKRHPAVQEFEFRARTILGETPVE